MANIKSMSAIAEKWGTVTPGRANYYEEGVRTTTRDWAGNTQAAAGAYAQGVSDAISRGAFAKGVGDAGSGKWQQQTLAKKARWADGVRLGKANYQSGFAPFHAVISGVALPPRGPRGDPGNWERARAIGDALSAARKAGS